MILENAYYVIELCDNDGSIHEFSCKKIEKELVADEEINWFSLCLAFKDAKHSQILARHQKLSHIELVKDVAVLSWNGPLKAADGIESAIDVKIRIELIDEAVEITCQLVNHSSATIIEIAYPLLAGLPLNSRYSGLQVINDVTLYEHRAGSERPSADLVLPYPSWGGLGMPWVDYQFAELHGGLYFAAHDPQGRWKALRRHITPQINNEQSTARLEWIFYPWLKFGETFNGPPVVLEAHAGDWHDAAKIYRRWFEQHFAIRSATQDWIRRQTAYYDTMFMNPEGAIALTFADMPRWAAAAKKYGVRTVLVSGWNVGGHDANYPLYEPDPRLGNYESLARAIEECHAMDMRVLFFVNTLPIHIDTDWYREKLHDWRALDEHGKEYGPYAFGMGTLGARMGWNTRQYTWASMGIEPMRNILVDYFRKLAEIGADGLHIDKFVNFGLDFNPLLSDAPDLATTAGQLHVAHEILDACRKINPEFSLSTESHRWDLMLQFNTVTWGWPPNTQIDMPVHLPVKFTFPEWTDSLDVTQPFDFNIVNNAVRMGFFLLLGYGNYTLAMDEKIYEPLSEYIREIMRLREELKDWLWFGDFLDDLEVNYEGPPVTRASVFRHRQTGRRAAVIVNFSFEESLGTLRSFAGNTNGRIRIIRPFASHQSTHLPLRFAIPGERLAIIVETE